MQPVHRIDILAPMEGDDVERTLNAIVGKALRGLMLSGASDEFIGSFAASHRSEVAQLLGIRQSSMTLSPEDAELIARRVADTAVKETLEQLGIAPRKAPSHRVGVKIRGHRTSVSIGVETFDKLVEARGSISGANQAIRSLAELVPEDIDNASAWVEERVEATLTFQTAAPADAAQKH